MVGIRCAKCGYNLHELTRPICPECGTPVKGAAGVPLVVEEGGGELMKWARANDAQMR